MTLSKNNGMWQDPERERERERERAKRELSSSTAVSWLREGGSAGVVDPVCISYDMVARGAGYCGKGRVCKLWWCEEMFRSFGVV
jgi:hypothetical protein